MGSEQRVHPRVPLALEVSYRSAGSFLVSYSVNLGTGGLFIETPEPLPVGTEMELQLQVPGVDQEIRLEGTVVWARRERQKGHPPGMGVKFSRESDAYGEVVDRLIRRFAGLRLVVGSVVARGLPKLRRLLRSVVAAEILEWNPAEGPLTGSEHQDLVVLDLDGGDGSYDGIEVLRRLRDERPQAALVALSRDPALRRRAWEIGADEAVANPPSTPDFRAAVLRALSRPTVLQRRSDET